ncbi:2Fe-2S iron-sulfur cluster-binding protein [Vibrio sp. SS-MA-C1-2]|uniref:2Fe-2S iron-sulfur cluster-binding protein n=1 Tax=Vibrio sp. SS-MA-C1-2 TaxID=2908646 RepID=UPI001F183172|nr:2Fe-2S iron-sulfur cluster-binding protein [Vibrio sp. SS-MA-C1-2]UJF20087.1 2Fe-2S iron-sulfur cluster-binding protein [Vibrio sp. SS-MA-C1-2]
MRTVFNVSEDQTLLDAALNAGINWPNRCQIGACASCLCRMISGEVHYDLAPVLTEKEQQQGWVMACLAQPRTDIEVTLLD